MTETKRCNKCGEEKSLEEFYPDTHGRDGRRSICKDCYRARVRENRARNPEETREKKKEYYRQNWENLWKYRQCVKNPKCPAVDQSKTEFVTFTCEVCGKEFRWYKSLVDNTYEKRGSLPRFCSRECYHTAQRKGYKSPYARNIERIKREVGA